MTERIDNIIQKELKHYLRLSSVREVYTIPQASFRMNCDRHQFEQLFVDTGKIKLHIRDGKKYVLQCEIDKYLNNEPQYVSAKCSNEPKFR